ncbi:MAG: hypothetical protein KAJ51_11330 [Thermoplasmata archaeon]|nr:hypothetical protein [Thermoplasmata archaeon]
MAEDEEKSEDEEKKEKPPEAKPITLPPSKEAESAPPSEQPPGYGPPPAYGPPPEPFFRANNLQKILAIGLLLGIIILLVGAILSASSGFIKFDEKDLKDAQDDKDLARSLGAAGQLVGAIGLFIIALFVILPLLLIHDLSDKQRKMLILLMMAIIIGFAFLTTNMITSQFVQ